MCVAGNASSQLPDPPNRAWAATADAVTAPAPSSTPLGSPVEPDVDRRPTRELHGIVGQLVQHLRNEIRRAANVDGFGGRVEAQFRLRIRKTVAPHASGHHGHEVEAFHLDVRQTLFEPRGLGHPGQDLGEPREALLRPRHVDAGIFRQPRGREIVERRAHDRHRSAQFMRQP